MVSNLRILFCILDKAVVIKIQGVPAMKKKIDAAIEEDLVSKAESIAVLKKLTLSELFEEALQNYLRINKKKNVKKSVSQDTRGAMRLSPEKLKLVMEEESFYDHR